MTGDAINSEAFQTAFDRFQELIAEKSGHPFTNFHEGMAAVWESYKPRLRDNALGLLGADEWSDSDIGSGAILQCMIEAIEIQESTGDLTNNLVFWQNRYGHANRDHRIFLEAAEAPAVRNEIESLLFGLYCGSADESTTFDRLNELTGGKYPLLAYLFFLKDMNRFMPIQPTGFDRAFRALDIDFSTLRQCSWENYSTYNETLDSLRPFIEEAAGLHNIRLVDAHSFCWIFTSLLKEEAEGTLTKAPGKKDEGRILGAREKSIWEMKSSVLQTVKQSRGQAEQRQVKLKELHMSDTELEALIEELLTRQEDRCALTGLRLQYRGTQDDDNLLPSLDRMDSNRHYEKGNLQVVCRFVNFWKQDTDNEEFKSLLMLVLGLEE